MKSSTKVSELHLYIFLSSTLRYSMGRQSYATGQCCDLIRQYGTSLEIYHLESLQRDLKGELDSEVRLGGTLGAPMDHAEWEQLLVFLDEIIDDLNELEELK